MRKTNKRLKKRGYSHLNQYQRDRLQAMLDSGHKQKEMAGVLNIDKSTVSREIKRNRRKTRKKGGAENGRYQAAIAQHKAYVRRKYSKYQGKKINENGRLKKYIVSGLKCRWSPDEISGKMRNEKQVFYASKTAIYDWMYSNRGQYWCRYLYSRRHKKRRQKKNKTKKALIPARIGIESRPRGAANRNRYGHYEGDTIVSGKKTGSKESLAVTYERKARYIGLRKIKSLKPSLFNQAVLDMKKELDIKTLTLDNGIENTKHQELDIDTYFCDPYSSWQKGGVENAGKMIRRFIPKGSDISDYSDNYVRIVENILNNKPRKSLNYKTPYEIMVKNNLFKDNQEIKKPEVALRG